MSNSSLSLLITPLLPTLIISLGLANGIGGAIYTAMIVYSFYVALYVIVKNLIEERKEIEKATD